MQVILDKVASAFNNSAILLKVRHGSFHVFYTVLIFRASFVRGLAGANSTQLFAIVQGRRPEHISTIVPADMNLHDVTVSGRLRATNDPGSNQSAYTLFLAHVWPTVNQKNVQNEKKRSVCTDNKNILVIYDEQRIMGVEGPTSIRGIREKSVRFVSLGLTVFGKP